MKKLWKKLIPLVLCIAAVLTVGLTASADSGSEVSTLSSSKQKLDVVFIMGQSNAQGFVNVETFKQARMNSVSCDEGSVFSTVAPIDSGSSSIAGVNFSSVCTADNAADYVARSLTSNISRSGKTLEYPLNSLTYNGGGKAGPDSGFGYEWNQLTGDAVWVVNIAYGGSSIASWQPEQSHYEAAVAVIDNVMDTYEAETGSSGSYTAGSEMMIWMQGECECWGYAGTDGADSNYYKSQFTNFYDSLNSQIKKDGHSQMDACGFITVRYTSSNSDGVNSIQDKSARKAQQELSATSGNNIYIASDANEDWITDSGTRNYFEARYPNGLSYPTHVAGLSVPTTVADVYAGVHYNQVGHNENGITAAEGMYNILYNGASSGSTKGTVKSDSSGKTIGTDVVNMTYNGQSGWWYTVNGEVDTSYTGFAENSYGWWYVKNGLVSFDCTGLYEGTVNGVYGKWYVIENAVQFDFIGTYGDSFVYNGMVKNSAKSSDSNGTNVSSDGATLTRTGLIKADDGKYKYYDNGSVDTSLTSVVHGNINGTDGWYYVKNGVYDSTYTGFAGNEYGWWYVESGKVTFNKNDILEGTVNGSTGWYEIIGSQVQLDHTGVTNTGNEYGWWYVVNGKVDFTYTGVAQNNYGWWRVVNGQVDFNFTGLAENEYGWWYCEDGMVNFNFTGARTNENGIWHVENGKVNFSYTGVADGADENGVWWYFVNGNPDKSANTVAKNSYGWWYVVNGRVDFSYTGVANYENEYGWWYIRDGQVDFGYTGLAQNDYGWWYVNAGQVDFSYTGGMSNEWGIWYCEKGQVKFDYTGLGDYPDENGNYWYYVNSEADKSVNDITENKFGWWYVVEGKGVDFSYTGVSNFSNSDGWWYINGGQVDFSYTGFGKNQNGWWWCSKGKVDFSVNDILEDEHCVVDGTSGSWWYVLGGQIQTGFTNISDIANSNGYWYIVNGKVDFSYTGLACNSSYVFKYVNKGKVDTSYTGFAISYYDMSYAYCVNGVVGSTKDIIQDTKGVISSDTGGWWYIVNGWVDKSYTGVSNFENAYGWWYIKNGKVDFSYTGFGTNDYGTWYVESGQVTFSKNPSTAGLVNGPTNGVGSDWYEVLKGEVCSSHTGVTEYANEYGWWYLKNGKVDFSFNGIAKNSNGYWYCSGGKVDFSYSFKWPLANYKDISSGYGYRKDPVYGGTAMHYGIDIAAPQGTTIMAVTAGTVVANGYDSELGYYIDLEDTGGHLTTRYQHMNAKSTLSVGTSVKQGATVGYVGTTGKSTGYHLHLGTKYDGSWFDPMDISWP